MGGPVKQPNVIELSSLILQLECPCIVKSITSMELNEIYKLIIQESMDDLLKLMMLLMTETLKAYNDDHGEDDNVDRNLDCIGKLGSGVATKMMMRI